MLSMLVLCNLTFVKATSYAVIADGEYYESFEFDNNFKTLRDLK